MNQLFEEVSWYIQQEKIDRSNVEALEIVEVIDSFCNFKKWADHMTDQALQFKSANTFYKQLNDVINSNSNSNNGFSNNITYDAECK